MQKSLNKLLHVTRFLQCFCLHRALISTPPRWAGSLTVSQEHKHLTTARVVQFYVDYSQQMHSSLHYYALSRFTVQRGRSLELGASSWVSWSLSYRSRVNSPWLLAASVAQLEGSHLRAPGLVVRLSNWPYNSTWLQTFCVPPSLQTWNIK